MKKLPTAVSKCGECPYSVILGSPYVGDRNRVVCKLIYYNYRSGYDVDEGSISPCCLLEDIEEAT
jgi:hypothetical protein